MLRWWIVTVAVLVLWGPKGASCLGQDAVMEPAAGAGVGGVDFREVVRHAKDRVFPCVVYIRCVVETLERGEKKSQEVSGSGVLISAGGEVLTNWHVIDKAREVRCLLSDGRHFDARIIGSDKATDLALIQLEGAPGETLPYAEFGDSTDLTEGDFVMAMGAPWGMNRSVSIGIISCTERYLEDISEYSLWLQTDAAINPGNSGGPLVNTAGQVVGINTRGTAGSADNLGFAVPSETILELLPQIREHGKVLWSWTGLRLQALRDFNKDMYFDGEAGVIITDTEPESPARRAGLEPLDRILRVNGEEATALTAEALPRVRRRLGLLPMNEPVALEVRRGDRVVTVEVTPREKGAVEGEELACPRWDLSVKEINQFDNPSLYFHRKEGVFIFGTKWPGNAANSGLREQDIILQIDGQDVQTLEDVKRIHEEALAQIDRKHRAVFAVLRNGQYRQVVLDYQRDYSK